MLLDEPSQGLAPKLVQDVVSLIARMKEEGVAVLLVEQHARAALASLRSRLRARPGPADP